MAKTVTLGPTAPVDHFTVQPEHTFSACKVTEGLPRQRKFGPMGTMLGAAGAVPTVTITGCDAGLVPQVFVTEAA